MSRRHAATATEGRDSVGIAAPRRAPKRRPRAVPVSPEMGAKIRDLQHPETQAIVEDFILRLVDKLDSLRLRREAVALLVRTPPRETRHD